VVSPALQLKIIADAAKQIKRNIATLLAAKSLNPLINWVFHQRNPASRLLKTKTNTKKEKEKRRFFPKLADFLNGDIASLVLVQARLRPQVHFDLRFGKYIDSYP
jgi:hypothetical protein